MFTRLKNNVFLKNTVTINLEDQYYVSPVVASHFDIETASEGRLIMLMAG